MQRDEPMLCRCMIEEDQEKLEEEFTDRQWNALKTKQDDARRSRLLYRHDILSVAAGQWKVIVSIPLPRGGESQGNPCARVDDAGK
jgi:hypothetical protein